MNIILAQEAVSPPPPAILLRYKLPTRLPHVTFLLDLTALSPPKVVVSMLTPCCEYELKFDELLFHYYCIYCRKVYHWRATKLRLKGEDSDDSIAEEVLEEWLSAVKVNPLRYPLMSYDLLVELRQLGEEVAREGKTLGSIVQDALQRTTDF